MKMKTARLLTEESGSIYEEYSGRGMYGHCTTGATFEDSNELDQALLAAAYECGQQAADDADIDAEDVLAELGNLRRDSMGLGVIVY